MANIYTTQKLVDSQDKAVIKLTARFDGVEGDEDQTKIDVSQLAYALNANGYIMSSDTDQKSTYRVSVTDIFYDLNISSGYLAIQWNGSDADPNTNTDMIVLHSGQHSMLFSDTRYPAVIENPSTANTNGDIIFKTVNSSANDSYSVILMLKKNHEDYDKGQYADPVAFNKGPAAL